VPRAELACGRVGDDGDVMAVQLVRPTLSLMMGRAARMAVNCCSRLTWRFPLLYASVAMFAPCVRAHALVGVGLVMRGGDFSCEVETSRARRRLVVRGGDFLCETETCCARRRLLVRGGDRFL
jgi:hypothetical protein